MMNVDRRAAVFAAMGEPVRLALVDALIAGDASPGALAEQLGLTTNLLAHHLRVLEDAGVVRRLRSEGDRRRSYVQLCVSDPVVRAAAVAGSPFGVAPQRVLFVCTANSARSQLAAASWNALGTIDAVSGGTHPASRVHPRAVRTARRHGLRLGQAAPQIWGGIHRRGDLVVAVCDQAFEELPADAVDVHWAIADPVRPDTDTAFEDALSDISARVHNLADHLGLHPLETTP